MDFPWGPSNSRSSSLLLTLTSFLPSPYSDFLFLYFPAIFSNSRFFFDHTFLFPLRVPLLLLQVLIFQVIYSASPHQEHIFCLEFLRGCGLYIPRVKFCWIFGSNSGYGFIFPSKSVLFCFVFWWVTYSLTRLEFTNWSSKQLFSFIYFDCKLMFFFFFLCYQKGEIFFIVWLPMRFEFVSGTTFNLIEVRMVCLWLLIVYYTIMDLHFVIPIV